MMFAGRFFRGLGDVFFPPVCVHCRGLVEEGVYRHVCERCARLIDFIRPPCCETCGHPASADGSACPHCEGLAPAFSRARAAVFLRGPARSLLLDLKYRGALHAAGDVERILRRSSTVLAHARGAVLVPVPLHPRKRRERGFNPSEIVASILARASGAAVRPLLRRVVDTPAQASLDRRARRSNLKNAFALAPRAALNADLRHVLVDDVFTTGSTLNACAGVLRRAGCLNLDAVTFAHG
jgi:ComF family protein